MTDRQKRLIENFIPLAKSICKDFDNLDYEERYSEALYGLVVAAQKFDYDNYDLNRFPNYAKMVVKNRLRKLYNKNTRNISVDWQSIENADEVGEAMLSKYLEDSEENYYNVEALKTCQKALTDEAFEIVTYLLEDKNQTEIADELNMSQPTVSRKIDKIKEELYEHFKRTQK